MSHPLSFLRAVQQALEERGAALGAAHLRDAAKGGGEEFESFVREMAKAAGITLLMTRDNRPWKSVRLPLDGSFARVEEVTAGRYEIAFVGGTPIWNATLSDDELRWQIAFPQEPLPMAAASEPMDSPASRVERLLDGEMELRVCPGLETGEILIRRLRTKTSDGA